MTHPEPTLFVGLDVHQDWTEACGLGAAVPGVPDDAVWTDRFRTTAAAFEARFPAGTPRTLCLEAGGSSPWVARLLLALGHTVVVCNPRQLRLIAQSHAKTDRRDAETLARLVRADPRLLHPITPRSEAAHLGRVALAVRHNLVQARTAFINTVKGLLRSFGIRLPRGRSATFVERVQALELPPALGDALTPLLCALHGVAEQIGHAEDTLRTIAAARPEVRHLQAVPGVGWLTALAFALCLDDPSRFRRSRDVGAYLGLVPTVRNSGARQCHGRITKAGDPLTRYLLGQAAQSCLNSTRPSALRDWGHAVMARRGRPVAAVALAHKLATTLHALWVSGEVYRPYPTQPTAA